MSSWLKLGQWMTKAVYIIASTGLLIIMSTVTLNVLGRGFFGEPLLGTVEIVGMAGVLLIPFALVLAERNRAHIVVEMLVSRLPGRLQSLFAIVTILLSLGGVVLLGWGAVLQVWDAVVRPDMVTQVLRVPKAPFISIWVVGCLFLCGYLLQHLFDVLFKGRKK